MAMHGSASLRTKTSHTLNSNSSKPSKRELKRKTSRQIRPRRLPLSDDVRRRALAILSNKAISVEIRGVIRYGLEINDPWTPEHVERVEAGENIIDDLTPQNR